MRGYARGRLLSVEREGRLAGVTEPGQALPLDRDLSSARARGDGAQIVSLLASRDASALLQSAGEALLVAAACGTEVPAAVVARLAGALEARDWPGDVGLARLLRAEPIGATSGRRAVSVDLDEVGDLLQGGMDVSYGGYIDLESGLVWPSSVLDAGDDDVPDPDADPDRYLFVPNEGSRDAWQDMSDFVQTVPDESVRARLSDAITGRGAFSRFRRELDRHEELLTGWRIFDAERRAGRARAWLDEAGFAVVPSVPAVRD